MKTIILQAYDKNHNMISENIVSCSNLILDGELVAFPTETVYGLGCSVFSENIIKVFEAKGRPSDNPLICHVSSIQKASECGNLTNIAKKLLECFSPGPITVVIEKSEIIPYSVTAGLSTVGVRIPENEVARAFLSACNVPVAAPSANTSKRPSPTRAKDVLEDMDGKIAGILDGGSCKVGIESTVVDARGEYPIILREGIITKEHIFKHFERCEFAKNKSAKVRSPGVKYTHYCPNVPMWAYYGRDVLDIQEFANQNTNSKIALICEDGFATNNIFEKNISVFPMGKNETEYMHNYYSYLRDLEKVCDTIIMQMPFSSEALKNRCEKSSCGRDIKEKFL